MTHTKQILAAGTLTLSMALSLFGCGSSSNETPSTSAQTEASESEKIPTEAQSQTTEESTTVKAGFLFIHDENSLYDKNFINSAVRSCEEMGIPYLLKTNIPEGGACYETICDLIDEGCNYIFGDSFGFEDYMIQAASEYPDVQFSHVGGTKAHTAGLDNYHNAYARIYEARYLTGISAGMKLNEMIENGEITKEEAKMGYVGAFNYGEVISGYTAFYLGARSVCPSVTMEVTFTNSWYDEALEKECAARLIAKGCLVISEHADSAGAPTACESAGVWNVSYNGSTQEFCPDTYLLSSTINWDPYMHYCLEAMLNNSPIDTDWAGGLTEGSLRLFEIGEKASEGTKEAMEEATEKIKSGELLIFDTASFTVNGEHLDSYLADVDTDPDYTPDTEAIKDGAFRECSLRSACYFDLNIDGISLAD